jgi:SAM-dependent methyltransferase
VSEDHFAPVSAAYAAFRPVYPPALIDALTDLAPAQTLVWDVGCGTGQASIALAQRFLQVHATDASTAQITEAEVHPRVTYRVAPESASGLADGSVALVTVAQALHWFDVDAFHAEARRVLMPHGVIAEWSYALLDTPQLPAIGELVHALDAQVHDWWPPERRHVENGYCELPFPFEPVDIGLVHMEADWSREQFLGYLGTWSAVTRCRKETGEDPLVAFTPALEAAWGAMPVVRLRWPLTLRVGRMEGAGTPAATPPQ